MASNQDRHLFISIQSWFTNLTQTNVQNGTFAVNNILILQCYQCGYDVYKTILTPYVGKELVLAAEHRSLTRFVSVLNGQIYSIRCGM